MTENLIEFSQKEIELIKSQIVPEATQKDLEMLIYQAKRTGLNPITRQIYGIFRNVKQDNRWLKKMTVQTSIDGFRVVAERSGDYGGQSEPVFEEGEDGKLISCKMTVYRFRGDTRYPAATAVAYWDEYCQKDKTKNKPTRMWQDMPRTMLSKVAEALALRKAYPQDLSGLYTNEEMEQSSNENSTKQKFAETSEKDMKEVFSKKNQSDFQGLKNIIESAGGTEELAEILKDKENVQIYNRLKKYEPKLLEMIDNSISVMKKEFEQ